MQLDELDHADPAYRDWLFARRLENQTVSLRLHVLIRTHAWPISENDTLIFITQNLVRAASSLWQAACLSDRLAAYDDLEDDDFFLTDGIIDKEFVTEPAARKAPDWPFFSHMNRARDALIAIASVPEPRLVTGTDVPAWVGLSYKACWVRHHVLLDRAVEAFAVALAPSYQGNGLPS